jgi:hypothetical protein
VRSGTEGDQLFLLVGNVADELTQALLTVANDQRRLVASLDFIINGSQ